MNPSEGQIGREIEALENELLERRKKLAELRQQLPKEQIQDYNLLNQNGSEIKLSDIFNGRDDLILIHNMGKGCVYCTMWADGFTGFKDHLENRSAFAVVSPDEPSVQKEFYNSRGWNFRMYSCHGSTFAEDLGFKSERGYMPGVSTFKRDPDGKIYRIASTYFGPGDDFNAAWHLFDLLEEGPNGWQPRYEY
jgi:predicted dithiol-disulfide oxidoreductase (DUF899 family)